VNAKAQRARGTPIVVVRQFETTRTRCRHDGKDAQIDAEPAAKRSYSEPFAESLNTRNSYPKLLTRSALIARVQVTDQYLPP